MINISYHLSIVQFSELLCLSHFLYSHSYHCYFSFIHRQRSFDFFCNIIFIHTVCCFCFIFFVAVFIKCLIHCFSFSFLLEEPFNYFFKMLIFSSMFYFRAKSPFDSSLYLIPSYRVIIQIIQIFLCRLFTFFFRVIAYSGSFGGSIASYVGSVPLCL